MTLGVGVQGMPTIEFSSFFLTTMTAGTTTKGSHHVLFYFDGMSEGRLLLVAFIQFSPSLAQNTKRSGFVVHRPLLERRHQHLHITNQH